MRTEIVLVFVGDDRIGLVEKISHLINEKQGNWLSSRLSRLAGKFAGIVEVSVDETLVEALESSLQQNLAGLGLTVVVERGSGAARSETTQVQQLTLLGLDRPGIVRDVSRALSSQQINVLELNTNIVPAAMTGEPMFDASATVEFSAETDLDELVAALESISIDLGVDIEFFEQE